MNKIRTAALGTAIAAFAFASAAQAQGQAVDRGSADATGQSDMAAGPGVAGIIIAVLAILVVIVTSSDDDDAISA